MTATVLGAGRFTVKHRVGTGCFGDVYVATDSTTNKDVAMKVETMSDQGVQKSMLKFEFNVYQHLIDEENRVVGIAYVHYFGIENDHAVMACDLLGPSLEELFNYCNRQFSLKTVLHLAEQMINRIEHVHKHHYIHRDIKPDNWLMGTGAESHHLYMIDFGLAKRYRHQGTHIPMVGGKAMTGTARYCATNAHLGLELSRRDDLESIGFVLLYLLQGQLPWQGINIQDSNEKTKKIGEMKKEMSAEELTADIDCKFFFEFLQYAKKLGFDQTPDYEWLREQTRKAMFQNGINRDWHFDWMIKRTHEHLTRT
jgi:serine/threonine protein kinase